MRISLKHLLLGMTFGSVVVLFYGYIKLSPQNIKPQNQVKEQVASNLVSQKNVDINEFIEPSINLITNNEAPRTKVRGIFSPREDSCFIHTLKCVVFAEDCNNIQAQVQFIELIRYKSTPLEVIDINPSPTPSPTPQTPKPAQVTSDQSINNVQVQIKNAPEEIVALIEKYAGEYGVDRNMMVGIAKCESGFRENAVNGPYAGIYQFVSGTWISNRRAMGLDENLELRYNAEEAVRTAAFKMSRDGFGAWPVCQHKAKILLGLKTNNI